MPKIHFHSFEALRFFAFLKVYLLHIPIQGDFPVFAYLKYGGGIGVSFFFVLSGFLITYILAFEKLQVGHVNPRKFLSRRILRIWPLFYLMVTLAFILPYEFKDTIGFHMVGGGYELDWRYSFFFLENYQMLLFDNFPKTTPLPVFWSLCIEMHFYLFWLVAFYLVPSRYILRFLFFSIAIAIGARFLEPAIFSDNHMIDTNDLFTNLDYFACGGILGFLVAKDYLGVTRFIKRIPLWTRYTILWMIVGLVIVQKDLLPNEKGTLFFILRPTLVACCFTVLLSLFIPPDSPIKIKSQILAYLGKISYGLYVYHIIFIHVAFQYCLDRGITIDDWWTLSCFMIITMGASIMVSGLSYKYFEGWFLSFKTYEVSKTS